MRGNMRRPRSTKPSSVSVCSPLVFRRSSTVSPEANTSMPGRSTLPSLLLFSLSRYFPSLARGRPRRFTSDCVALSLAELHAIIFWRTSAPLVYAVTRSSWHNPRPIATATTTSHSQWRHLGQTARPALEERGGSTGWPSGHLRGFRGGSGTQAVIVALGIGTLTALEQLVGATAGGGEVWEAALMTSSMPWIETVVRLRPVQPSASI